MSGIFGIVHLAGRPLDAAALRPMRAAMARWGPDGVTTACLGSAGFGHALLCSTPESRHESMPVVDEAGGRLVVAAARLDNRDELCDALELTGDTRTESADGRLVALAYFLWGEQAPGRLRGDWSFAAWHQSERRLFLARDHIGITGLHYVHRPPLLAFASDQEALLALPEVPRVIDEPQLARYLAMVPGDDWSHTFWRGVYSLLPAHVMVVTPERAQRRCYWRLEDAAPVIAPSQQDYLDGFLHHFGRAVHSRLRSSRPVGATLSGGLDSGSVTALAARELAERGQGLTAYTSVPLFQPEAPLRGVLADEWPLAHAVAERFANVEHVALRSEVITPVEAIRRYTEAGCPPVPGATHLYWLLDLFDSARRRGLGVLLTGGLGNGGVSWSGGRDRIYFLFAQGRWGAGQQALAEWRARHGASWAGAAHHHLLRPLLRPLVGRVKRSRHLPARPGGGYSFINPDFARQHGVAAMAYADAALRRPLPPLQERLLTLGLNAAASGPVWHTVSGAWGVEVRDPTTDVALLEYCMGVPNSLHNVDGGERMLIRQAMAGLLPDEVRWNSVRGRQAADVVPRMLARPEEMEQELHYMRRSDMLAQFFDTESMARTWAAICTETGDSADPALPLSLLRGVLIARILSKS